MGLFATFSVSGTPGMATAKRLSLPAQFQAAQFQAAQFQAAQFQAARFLAAR
jgi:hypothetical protein